MIEMRLKSWREAVGMSQAEAARRLELSPGAVNHHETGRNAPSPADVRRYAEIYGRPGDDLISALLLLAGVERGTDPPNTPEIGPCGDSAAL